MTTYCKLGDTQSTVSYSFGNNKPTVLTIKNAPIEVNTRAIGNMFSGLCSCEQYFVGWSYDYFITRTGQTGHAQGAPADENNLYASYAFWGKITNIRVREDPIDGSTIEVLCRGRSFLEPCQPGLVWRLLYHLGNNSKTAIINNAYIDNLYKHPEHDKICPDDNTRCEIKVSYNNKVIHSEEGNCPINYSVVCGDECPEGTIKCFSTNYPGYCCIPCSEIKSEISAIASIVRSLNHG